MKKNKMMRVASFLLVAVLLSTSVISGTFAKYTTQDNAGDAARVAKWGVELQVAGVLYGEHYEPGDSAPSARTSANAASVTVGTTGTNIVAPGTKSGNGLSFKLSGKPEVSGTVTTELKYENIYLTAGEYGVIVELGTLSQTEFSALMAASADTDKLYVKSGSNYVLATTYDASETYYTLEDYVNVTANYYPVVYALDGTAAGNTTADSLAAAVTAFATNLGTAGTPAVADGKTTVTYTATFNPNEDLSTKLKIADKTITWAWAFGSATPAGNDAPMSDKADTILGNLAAGGLEVVKNNSGTWSAPEAASGADAKDYNLETEFSIDITVSQVD